MNSIFNTKVDFQADRARLFARAPKKILLGHIASVCVLIYLAYDVLALHWLVIWGAWEIFGSTTILFMLGKQVDNMEQNGLDLDKWQKRLYMLFAVVGLSWGTFVAFGLDIQNPAHFSVQMAIVAGASASASRSLGIFKFSFFYYEIPFAGLLAIRIFMLGGDFILLGVLVIIFIILMCGLANDTSEELSDYLATKLDNLELAEKYKIAAKEAELANTAKTQFLSQANHDLRQPIHAIGLLTECLRDQKLNKEGKQILNTIDTSVEDLSHLFKSLLNITSLESGVLKPKIMAFSLDEVLKQIMRQALPEAEERGCTLKVVSTSIWVKTDKALLISILQNLVFNAIKYAPNSKILIGARIQNEKANVYVLDQGIGVPENLQKTIFDEFVRANPHGPNRVEGLGLGLSIVSRTAQLLNLKIDFKSAENVGTKISVCEIETTTPQQSTVTVKPVSNISSKKRVLIIDDNKQVLEGMKLLIEKWGYDVEVQKPNEKLDKSFDILLIDFHLNEKLNGIELAAKLRQKTKRNFPTAIISGTMNEQMEQLAKHEGHLTLQKPVAPMQLRSVLLSMSASLSPNQQNS